MTDHQALLDHVVGACREQSAALGVPLPRLRVRLMVDPAEPATMTTNLVDTVEVVVADEAEFVPLRVAGLTYGVCHEAGHIVVAQVSAGGRLPPVVYDEALAHLLAIDHFLPALRELGVAARAAANGAAAAAPADDEAAPADAFGVRRVLERHTDELRRLRDRFGVTTLLTAVGRTGTDSIGTRDWMRWLTGVLERDGAERIIG